MLLQRAKPLMAIILLVLLSACAGSGEAEELVLAVETGGEAQPAAVEEASSTPVPEASSTPEPPVPTATTEIVHLTRPGEPLYLDSQLIRDCDTGSRTDPGEAADIGLGCDRWDDNYIERPTDIEGQVYFGDVDIVRARLGYFGDWFYTQIEVFGDQSTAFQSPGVLAAQTQSQDVSYVIEIDLDLDARGDILIIVTNPQAGDWSVAGVQVWFDTNDDVGGGTAVYADGSPGNGYETLLFDSGEGDDPDLVWARLSPEGDNLIEIAFKNALLDGITHFEWWGWAVGGEVDPALFDYVDSYAEDAIFEIDNTCGWIFGGLPREDLANMCDFFKPTATPKPTRPPDPPPGGGGSSGCSPSGAQPPSSFWDPASCSWIIIN